MFMAENPNFQNGQPVQSPQNSEQFQGIDFQQQQPGHAQTMDPKLLLNRERQFIQYAPQFDSKIQNPYEQSPGQVRSSIGGSTRDTTLKVGQQAAGVRSQRANRFEPRQYSRNPISGYEISESNLLNEREASFDLALSMQNQQYARQPQAPTNQRQALSVRPGQGAPRSTLINSAKMQIGAQPSATLHNSSVAALLPHENPLFGVSDGERQHRVYQQEFMKYALSKEQGSMGDIKERSRSKSRRARYEQLRREADQSQEQNTSLVDIMTRTRTNVNPNQFAQKQRFAYSRAGSALSGHNNQSQIQQPQGQPTIQNYNIPQQPRTVQQSPRQNLPKVIDIGDEFHQPPPEFVERDARRAEYQATLLAQIEEKNERKRLAKLKVEEEDARFSLEYVDKYRFGALNVGGGSPVRNRNGEIIAQHVPFSSQSQHGGGVEDPSINLIAANQRHLAYQETLNQRELSDTLAGATSTYSPKKQEIIHMKPSNQFEDITEQEFDKREQDKKAYQNELMKQMEEAQNKKKMEKERMRKQDVEDDVKIHRALDQMRDAFNKEENPDTVSGSVSQFDRDSQHQVEKTQERSRSRVRVQEYQVQEQEHYQPQIQNIYIQEQQPLLSERPTVNAHIDQMERLKRVQEDIDRRVLQDKQDTENIFRDLLESNKSFSNQLSQYNNSPFSIRNIPNLQSHQAPQIQPSSFLDQKTSGNLRLESRFEGVGHRINSTYVDNAAGHRFKAPQLSPISGSRGQDQTVDLADVQDDSILGGPSSQLEQASKSAIGKLDDLLEDFSKQQEGQE